MSSFGLNIDEFVTANPLAGRSSEYLGVSAANSDLRSRVVFASFSDSTVRTYSDYNRIFDAQNVVPLHFPSHEESFPDSRGIGIGLGLQYNKPTLVIECNQQISAIKLIPACVLTISVTSILETVATQLLGQTVLSSDGTYSTLNLPAVAGYLILEHMGSLDLIRIELFTESIRNNAFAVFPITTFRHTLPYLTVPQNELDVTRIGGLQNESATLFTTELARASWNTNLVSKAIINLSVESRYLEENQIYRSILNDTNALFPCISRMERNCIKHKKGAQDAIQTLNAVPATTTIVTVVPSIFQDEQLFFHDKLAPSHMDIVAGVTYRFEPDNVEINGLNVSSVLLADGETVIYGINGTTIGVLRGHISTYKEILQVPVEFMSDTPLQDVLNDILSTERPFGNTTQQKTPNSGNVVTHAAFIDSSGTQMTCEQSIFLPSETRSVVVYCSEAGTDVSLSIDGVEEYIINIPNQQTFQVVEINLPINPGIHSLQSNKGSNVLFRISEKSIVHAPIHPPYYTSGQLDRDSFSSSQIEIIAQLNNFDLLPAASSIKAVSNTKLVNIPDVVFNEFECQHALFCRHQIVDLKNSALSFEHAASFWAYCDDVPWLACLNAQNGCSIIYDEILLNNFTLYWYLENAATNRTLVQGTNCLFVQDNKLILLLHEEYECDFSHFHLHQWNHIAFTASQFFINGVAQETVITPLGEKTNRTIILDKTIIGTCFDINLMNIGSINIPDFAVDRFVECVLTLTHTSQIMNFQMTTSTGNVLWTNVNPSARCLATRARPKSAIRASPRASRRMLLGLICMWCSRR
jgi:hypothetical protein